MKIRTCKTCGFTGEESLFREKRNQCKKCRKEFNKKYNHSYGKKYRAQHQEELSNKKKKYYQENKDLFKNRYEKNIERIRERKKRHYQENKKEINEKNKQYYQNNKEEICEKAKEHRIKNKESIREQKKKYYKKNKKEIQKKQNVYNKQREDIDEIFKLQRRIRSRLYNAIKRQYTDKSDETIKLLGCDWETVKEHLESQFKEGMSWENHGRGEDKWNIDHIRPCASFDLSDPEQQKKCFHYTNLQPLWWRENIEKRDLIILTKEDLA